MGTDAPNTAVAGDLAASAVGRRPTEVRRFGTGSHHYVFEAMFEDRPAVVVRIAAGHSRSAMAGALRLSRLLRPQGVPLPEIIAERLNHQFPHLVLERLPGSDLGEVIRGLSDSSLEAISAKVARAQWVTAKTASSGRYGYGVASTNAPHDKWSRVLQDNLARSRRRIAAAGLFDLDAVDAVAAMTAAARDELDSLPPIPFLHDTTTKNVIVTSAGAFSGIVDVDDLCFGDPRYVVALTLASLTASGGPAPITEATGYSGSTSLCSSSISCPNTARYSTAICCRHPPMIAIICSASLRSVCGWPRLERSLANERLELARHVVFCRQRAIHPRIIRSARRRLRAAPPARRARGLVRSCG
jgi:aminoglycoside phosphotransferase (APT) family kinase protein